MGRVKHLHARPGAPAAGGASAGMRALAPWACQGLLGDWHAVGVATGEGGPDAGCGRGPIQSLVMGWRRLRNHHTAGFGGGAGHKGTFVNKPAWQDAWMSTPTAAAPRQKKTSGPPGKPRRRSGPGNGQPSRGRPGRWLWPLVIAVFLVAYIVDTGAVGHLLWACLAGQFGPRVRLAAWVVVVLVGGIVTWAFLRRSPRPSAAPVRKPRPGQRRGIVKSAPPGPGEAATPDHGATGRKDLPKAARARAASGRPVGRS
jgi:hypothetical protein